MALNDEINFSELESFSQKLKENPGKTIKIKKQFNKQT